jgi:tRNA (cytidine32/uridine32-2'-O)-methyltransferase
MSQIEPGLPNPDSTAALARIRVVLCDTQEPGNIGAAARAMKTMGLSDLHLVRPKQFPHGLAHRLAVSAADLLERAVVHRDLTDAVAGCHGVFGVSARQRAIPVPLMSPRDLGPTALAAAGQAAIALVFGGEEAGLSNADLELCSTLVQIPSDPACRSLNLASAVQLIAYELRLASLGSGHGGTGVRTGAPIEDFERLLGALDAALLACGYYGNKNQALALVKLRRILQRAHLDRSELQMLHGVIRQLSLGASARDQDTDSR